MLKNRSWNEAVATVKGLLDEVSFSDGAGDPIGTEEGFVRWRSRAEALRDEQGIIYLIGNGASASMASHFSADLAKNAGLNTQVFSDLSLITAISNDIGYDQVFALPLRRRARDRDMLIAISSSGSSPNILRAAEAARDLEVTVVTLSAMKADNPLRKTGDLNIYVPAGTYSDAETCHAAILHHWMDRMEEKPEES